jgi:hypothetical protein
VCGGSGMKRWLPPVDHIEIYAKFESCERVRICGREGWLRVRDGFEEKHITTEKELS